MCRLLSVLLIVAIIVAIAIIVGKRLNRPKRIMQEGKLLKSEMVSRDGEMFYVEKIAFKDWHVSLHNFYLISDRLSDGHTIVEQKWSYEDFCDVTIRLDDCTYALNRQVEVIALVRSFRPIPVDIQAHVRFVGRLVIAEPKVPVYTIGAILRGHRADGLVETADAVYQFHCQGIHSCPGRQVAVPVGIEPLLVVVQGQVLKES